MSKEEISEEMKLLMKHVQRELEKRYTSRGYNFGAAGDELNLLHVWKDFAEGDLWSNCNTSLFFIEFLADTAVLVARNKNAEHRTSFDYANVKFPSILLNAVGKKLPKPNLTTAMIHAVLDEAFYSPYDLLWIYHGWTNDFRLCTNDGSELGWILLYIRGNTSFCTLMGKNPEGYFSPVSKVKFINTPAGRKKFCETVRKHIKESLAP
jgi:hypothetical protein